MTVIIIKSRYHMSKIDEVVNIWLDEMSQAVPFEPFEKSLVPVASAIKEGDIVEALAIGYVDPKYTTKAMRLAKKRWKVYEKVEGFSYTVDVYESGVFPEIEQRYNKWKEDSNLQLAKPEELF